MKFKIGDKVKTYQKGFKQQGSVQDFWFDGEEFKYYVLIGKERHLWAIPESWLRPVKQN